MFLNKNVIYVMLLTIFISFVVILTNLIFANKEFQIKNHSKKLNLSWKYNEKLISCLKEISIQKQKPLKRIVLIIEDTNLQTPFAKTIYEEKKQLLKITLYLPDSLLIKKNNVAYARAVYTNLTFSLMEHYKSQDQQGCLYEEYLETRNNPKQYFNISLK